MRKKDEAMKLALEALEYIHEGANNQGPHTGISWRCVSNKAESAITALRQALANEALDKMAENARELGLDYEPPCKTGSQCTNKCQQCEQPAQQQEPVAYDKTEINCFAQDLYDQKMREGKRGHYESMFHVIHQCIKKVSPQPSKPWVGLTDEDLAGCDDEELKQARYWEAKLREKNA